MISETCWEHTVSFLTGLLLKSHHRNVKLAIWHITARCQACQCRNSVKERVHMFWKTGMTSSPPQMHVVISRLVMSDLVLSTTMCLLWSTQVLCCHFWPSSLWATENWVTSFIHNRGAMFWHSSTRLICISFSDAPSPSSVWLKVLSGLQRKIKSGSIDVCDI